jgi:hypothetical protein
MDCRVKPGNDEKGKRRRFPKYRGRRWVIASHPLNRTTVL